MAQWINYLRSDRSVVTIIPAVRKNWSYRHNAWPGVVWQAGSTVGSTVSTTSSMAGR